MLWILIVVLLVFALVGVPGIGYPHTYGYYPSGLLTVVIVVLIILLLMGRI